MISTEPAARRYCLDVLGDAATARLEQFVELLWAENAQQNLIASSTLPSIWSRHIADSLQLITHVPRGTGEWLDLGSGGGLPALVIAIAQSRRQVTAVESRKLRAEWLSRASALLNLPNVRVVPQRLEALEPRAASVISARAFAPLAKLLRLSARFSTPETVWVLPKGRNARDELAVQPPAIQRMFHVEPSVTDPLAGILVGQGRPELR